MARDPYKYFRIEARELLQGLSAGVLDLEQGRASAELTARLLRLAHTVKGAARVVKQPGMADLAHQFEGALEPFRDGRAVPPEVASQLLGLIDGMGAALAALEAPPADTRPPGEARRGEGTRPNAPAAIAAPAPPAVAQTTATAPAAAPADDPDARPRRLAPGSSPPPRPAEDVIDTVRVDLEQMDALLDGVTESSTRLTALRRDLAALDRIGQLAGVLHNQLVPRRGLDGAAAASNTIARARVLSEELRDSLERMRHELGAGVDQVGAELSVVHEKASRLRLVPASSLFLALERAARDAAQTVGVTCAFSAGGGDCRLDAHVLTALRGPLLQIVKNAVAHGVEPAIERSAAGKPTAGKVELTVERRGGDAVFTCRDDGRGIDVAAVKRAAVARGRLAEDAPLDLDGAIRLIFESGLSTSGALNQVAGRGIGLDIVGDAIARLKGRVRVDSAPSSGTTVEVAVPIDLSAMAVLMVEADGVVAAIPLPAVGRALRLEARDITRSPEGASVAYDDKVIPFVPLAKALGRAGDGAEARAWSAIVVRHDGRMAAVGVDHLRGLSDVVVRSLPALAPASPVVAGATLDAEGHPQLLLDAGGLIAAALADRGDAARRPAIKRAPVLIIDDSLTTRMLEQSILESAGYDVELATSAEEGLERARERPHCLFLVDVEMPGMNGFEFVATTRADGQLSRTPAILVSSLNAPADILRGEQAGAKAYIVKGEFDQGHLLRTIERVIG